jgi:hypothetical protein
VTAETLLGFGRTREFHNVTISTFIDARAVGASCHVRMSSRSVTVHTLQTFIDMIAVCEFYDFLLNLIAKIKDVLMAVQTAL